MEERLRQTITVLKKITGELGIPYTSPEVQELKGRLDEFVRSGEAWEGKIPFTPWGRVAHVVLSGRNVEVTLKMIRYKEKNQKRRGSKGESR